MRLVFFCNAHRRTDHAYRKMDEISRNLNELDNKIRPRERMAVSTPLFARSRVRSAAIREQIPLMSTAAAHNRMRSGFSSAASTASCLRTERIHSTVHSRQTYGNSAMGRIFDFFM